MLILISGCAPLDSTDSQTTSEEDGGGDQGPDDRSLRLVPSRPNLFLGQTLQLNAVLGNIFGTDSLDGEPISWMVSDPSIASIDEQGRVTGAAVGESTIVMQVGSDMVEAPLTVVQRDLVDLLITPSRLTTQEGEAHQLSASGRFTDGSSISLTSSVTWTSSDPQIVTVDALGLAEALTPGEAQISISLPEFPELPLEPLEVVVQPSNTSSTGAMLTVSPGAARISIGDTLGMRAMVRYANGAAEDVTDQVQWSSSDETIAQVDEQGLVEGLLEGSAELQAHMNSLSSEASQITVAQLYSPISLTVTPTVATASVGATLDFELMAQYAQGPPRVVTATAAWTSTNPSIATVSSGRLTTHASGQAQLNALYGGLMKLVQITVTP